MILGRLRDLLWAVDMEGDVASDLSVFHRIDDMYGMGSRRWAQLAPRLIAYQGAVQLKFKTQHQQPAESAPQPVAPAPALADGDGGGVLRAHDGTILLPGPPSPWKGGEVVDASPAALRFSDIGDMFSFA